MSISLNMRTVEKMVQKKVHSVFMNQVRTGWNAAG